MTDPSEPDWELIAEVLGGGGTPEARGEVVRWIERTPEHRALHDRLRRMWDGIEDPAFPPLDVNALKARVLAQVVSHEEDRARSTRVARPRFVSRFDSTATRGWRFAYGALAAIAVFVTIMRIERVRLARSVSTAAAAERVIATPRGRRLTVRLEDGSTIALNAASTLRLPAHFGDKTRTLTLDGEARFTVAHGDVPFVVSTPRAVLRVLGTTFDVRTYPSETMRVVVASGKVAMTGHAASAASVTLAANDLAELGANGVMRLTHDVVASHYFGWAEGELIFRSVPLRDVLVEVGRAYDVTVTAPVPALAAKKITATLHVGDSARDALDALADVVGGRVVAVGTSYIITNA